ncbi:MAG: hypothetical protein ACMUIA_04480 [bacterium]
MAISAVSCLFAAVNFFLPLLQAMAVIYSTCRKKDEAYPPILPLIRKIR